MHVNKVSHLSASQLLTAEFLDSQDCSHGLQLTAAHPFCSLQDSWKMLIKIDVSKCVDVRTQILGRMYLSNSNTSPK